VALTLVHHGAAHVGQAGAAQRLRHVRGRYDLHLQGRERGGGQRECGGMEWNGSQETDRQDSSTAGECE
jgi:hypothetical protein